MHPFWTFGLVAEIGRRFRNLGRRVQVWKIRRRGRPLLFFERRAGIGDIICTFPAALALKKKFPEALLIYVVRIDFEPIVRMAGIADAILTTEGQDEGAGYWRRAAAYYFRPQLEDETPAERPSLHLVDDFCDSLGVEPDSRQPVLHVPEKLAEEMAARIREIAGGKTVIGIHVGPSWPVREWPEAHWNQLIELLGKSLSCVFLQLGSDSHTVHGRMKAPRIRGTIDWVDRLNLEETVAVIRNLDLFLGIDSGLLHIAGAVGTPCVGLFGAIDPRLRLPPETPSIGVTSDVPCLGCHHRKPRLHWQQNCPYDIACMKQLEPARVAQAVIQAVKALTPEIVRADMKN